MYGAGGEKKSREGINSEGKKMKNYRGVPAQRNEKWSSTLGGQSVSGEGGKKGSSINQKKVV